LFGPAIVSASASIEQHSKILPEIYRDQIESHHQVWPHPNLQKDVTDQAINSRPADVLTVLFDFYLQGHLLQLRQWVSKSRKSLHLTSICRAISSNYGSGYPNLEKAFTCYGIARFCISLN
jgi:hypothetical protein